MGMLKKHIKRDLQKHLVETDAIDRLERAKISQRGTQALQEIFGLLLERLDQEVERNSALQEEMENKDQALEKQRKQIVRMNEKRDRGNTMTREEKIFRLKIQGMTQEEIADGTGISRSRVSQILRGRNPLSILDDSWFPSAIRKGVVDKETRDQKIQEWREQGYSQTRLAEMTGLSRSRVAEILSAKMHSSAKNRQGDPKKNQKNLKKSFHRNTRTKIEQIRKVAPKLAQQCENREISVRSAYKQVEGDLYRVGIKRNRLNE